jgi:hypothetical protein
MVIVGSSLALSSCAPKMVQLYPASTLEERTSISEILDRLSSGDRILIQAVGGPLMEAVLNKREPEAILVNRMVWDKQIMGDKLVESDEVTKIMINDLQKVCVYRTSTGQKIGYCVAAAVFVGAVYAMTSVSEEGP